MESPTPEVWCSGSSFASGEVGDIGFFSSCSRFSKPSTLFRRASSTSVLGPRFLGTASGADGIRIGKELRDTTTAELTVDTRALEDLAGLTAWSQAITFDLGEEISGVRDRDRCDRPFSCDRICSS